MKYVLEFYNVLESKPSLSGFSLLLNILIRGPENILEALKGNPTFRYQRALVPGQYDAERDKFIYNKELFLPYIPHVTHWCILPSMDINSVTDEEKHIYDQLAE